METTKGTNQVDKKNNKNNTQLVYKLKNVSIICQDHLHYIIFISYQATHVWYITQMDNIHFNSKNLSFAYIISV
jgi:hypothetical protein